MKTLLISSSRYKRETLHSGLVVVRRVAFLLILGAAAWATDVTVALADDKKDADQFFLTFTGQVLLLLGAALGAGGGLRYFLEPLLRRRQLRKVMATGLWLACYELRRHLEAIKATLAEGGTAADAMRDAMLKIPRKRLWRATRLVCQNRLLLNDNRVQDRRILGLDEDLSNSGLARAVGHKGKQIHLWLIPEVRCL
jgi:hypothetical protein